MQVFSLFTIIAASLLPMVAAHGYMSDPPCFNCPRNPAVKPRNVKILGDPLKAPNMCRGVPVPALSRAHKVSGDELTVEITTVAGHDGPCTFTALDTNLKNPVKLAVRKDCAVKKGKQTVTIPLKGITGTKVLHFLWEHKDEIYDNCALINVTSGNATSSAKQPSKKEQASRRKERRALAAAPQESGWDNDEGEGGECEIGEMECHGDGFRQCSGDGEWIYRPCGDGTTCTWLPGVQGVTCASEDE